MEEDLEVLFAAFNTVSAVPRVPNCLLYLCFVVGYSVAPLHPPPPPPPPTHTHHHPRAPSASPIPRNPQRADLSFCAFRAVWEELQFSDIHTALDDPDGELDVVEASYQQLYATCWGKRGRSPLSYPRRDVISATSQYRAYH
jgi:hypothetical protein